MAGVYPPRSPRPLMFALAGVLVMSLTAASCSDETSDVTPGEVGQGNVDEIV